MSDEHAAPLSLEGAGTDPAGVVPRSIVLMGVCGCGKTEVGRQLARMTAGTYLDGDDYHSAENIAKMGRGAPLVDADRRPWLARLRDDVIAPSLRKTDPPVPVILGCSALRRDYREALIEGLQRDLVWFVHLHGAKALILERMKARQGHYMKEGMVESQFAILEKPACDENSIEVSIEPSPENIARNILTELSQRVGAGRVSARLPQ